MKTYKLEKDGFEIRRHWFWDDQDRKQVIQIILPDEIDDLPWETIQEKGGQLIAVLGGLPIKIREEE